MFAKGECDNVSQPDPQWAATHITLRLGKYSYTEKNVLLSPSFPAQVFRIQSQKNVSKSPAEGINPITALQ